MRVMQLDRPLAVTSHPLALVERPDPRPGSGELVLRVAACAVCRTDLQLCEGELSPRRLPIVPGHQVVARVVEVGAGVEGWRPGDRAGVGWLGGACGRCSPCRDGSENLCDFAAFTGWDEDGGYAEKVAVRAPFALRIPERFDDAEAAPLLCGGVIGYRSLLVSGVRPGQRLGLYGFGASATLALQVAAHWGCRSFVCTRSPAEQARAKALGAEWAGSYEDTPPEPLDAAVTFAPAGRVVIAALGALRRGGTVAINAIHLDAIPSFDYQRLWWERSLRSVSNYTRQDARAFLDLAAQIPIRTRYEVYELADANTALARLKLGKVSGAAVLRVGR